MTTSETVAFMDIEVVTTQDGKKAFVKISEGNFIERDGCLLEIAMNALKKSSLTKGASWTLSQTLRPSSPSEGEDVSIVFSLVKIL